MSSEVIGGYNRLSQEVMPRTEETYTRLIDLYSSEQQDLQRTDQKIEGVLLSLSEKITEASNNINELTKKTEKDRNVVSKADKYVNAKEEEIKNKNKMIESIISGLKEAVSKIKPLELAKLPVEKERSLQETFKTLFKVLYSEKEQNFLWKDFKKKALEHQDGQDFQSRLANINVRMISEEDYNKLRQLKGDPELEKLSENPKYSDKLIDIGDWMEHVCAGYEFHADRAHVVKDKIKIEGDVHRRTKEGKLAIESLQFWKDTLNQAEDFQNNLTNIEARLKTIKIGLETSIPRMKGALEESRKKFYELPRP